jgi:lipoyl(octanoyl) transferase
MPDKFMPLWIDYRDLGLSEYKYAWDLQEMKNEEIIGWKDFTDKADYAGQLIFCEHPHVFTLGKSGHINNLLINDDFLKTINASYYKSNRGGDVTYHGPGQIVGYPIFDLDKLNVGVKIYVHKLEEAVIAALNDFNITASRLEGATGVWLEAGTSNVRKICAIGVRISKAVTMHGFALNVNTDLNYFSYINPCGFIDKGVTSIEKELGSKQNIEFVKANLKEKIARVFSLEIR